MATYVIRIGDSKIVGMRTQYLAVDLDNENNSIRREVYGSKKEAESELELFKEIFKGCTLEVVEIKNGKDGRPVFINPNESES